MWHFEGSEGIFAPTTQSASICSHSVLTSGTPKAIFAPATCKSVIIFRLMEPCSNSI